MLPWSFSEEAASEKHAAQLQHNMLVTRTRRSVLSIINGGGKWVEISIEADLVYQTGQEGVLERPTHRPSHPAFSIANPPGRALRPSAWSI